MVFDDSDNTLQICEGGVWVDLTKVAERLGVNQQKKFVDWANENLGDWNDYLIDSIVDFAMDKISEIYRDEGPGVDETGDDR